uniref:Uncharacterized protein n=1 Tax=Tetraodon nigroviridis TaxID=99883 RepID=H3CFJ8_TETNG
PAGLTAATMAEALALQKMRMMMGFHGNSEQPWHQDADRTASPSDLDDTGASEGSWEKEQRVLPTPLSVAIAPPPGSASLRLNSLQQRSALLANRLADLPFMVMPHPLLPVGLPPAGVAMAMNQMSQLSGLANMAAISQIREEDSKDANIFASQSPPGTPSLSPSPSDDEPQLPEATSQSPSRASSSLLSSPPPPAHTPELDESLLPLPLHKPTYEKLPLSLSHANPALAPFLLAEGLSSMETLLTNIQGLLKVAVQSARCQDKQNQMERKELKVELDKERDARQTLQRQLSSELQTRASIQKRLKKEKKAKRRLQEALDFESRRREQVERALKHSDLLTAGLTVADAVIPDIDLENKEQENPAAQGSNGSADDLNAASRLISA